MAKVSIQGLPKVDVLLALYEGADGARTDLLNPLLRGTETLTREEAEQKLKVALDGFVDYVKGHPIKARLSEDVIESATYDEDNGVGQMQMVIDKLRQSIASSTKKPPKARSSRSRK